ncbi:uncharacterized protein LOC126671103 [Mercurialis annua]|uniref:uncharacterized protein LOC126671103 n=1 Tax=Mercurialis annua TaxID=3986 RepID=UPI0024AD827D|nr:uncharacterized protein LOC126671103 [Mercurialis annua]
MFYVIKISCSSFDIKLSSSFEKIIKFIPFLFHIIAKMPPFFNFLFILVPLLLTFLQAFSNMIPSHLDAQTLIMQACAGVENPNSCCSKMQAELERSKYRNSTSILSAALQNSLNEARRAIDSITKFNSLSISYREQVAIEDCKELLDFSVSELAWSLAEMEKIRAGDHNIRHEGNLKAWLSAALSNQDTCLEGFEGTDRHLENFMKGSLKQVTQLIGNVLALYIQLHSMPFKPSRNGTATNISPEFPEWMTEGDRELLKIGILGVHVDAIVSLDGTGHYNTITQALDDAPDHSNRRYIIYVKQGMYRENIDMKKKKTMIMLIGDGIGKTIITGNRNFMQGWTTFRTATVAVSGRGFIARDVTFRNTAGPVNHQAVALRVDSDQSAFFRCSMEGYQDTLYAHSLRQFYRECEIYGTIDYIFGNGAAVFQNCKIYTRVPLPLQKVTITAQGRKNPHQSTGFSIQDSYILATEPTYLGRPWKEFSRTVFINTYMSGSVQPRGWLEWYGNFALGTLWYGEYKNYGPGASVSGRVKWPGYHIMRDAATARFFTAGRFIDGMSWLPSTGVKFTAGLSNFNPSMASNLSTLSAIFLVSVLFFFSETLATAPNSTDTLCNSTPYPHFCKSSLPHNRSANIHDYGRVSLRRTLSYARKFRSLIAYLLTHSSPFSHSTIAALQDCQFLAQLNIDSLSYTLTSINYTDKIQRLEASDLQTLLSATLTNLQTCLDGLQASKTDSGLLNNSVLVPISNGTKQCSISLAFFTHGWVPPAKKGRSLISERKHAFSELRNGVKDGLPLKMSKQDRKLFESVNRRKTIQIREDSNSVVVKQLVIVDRKGSGNFTSINDAIGAAPNNTGIGNGYFVIYVMRGQYQEYVSIPSNKHSIMMIGEGTGRTVITGNRSVVDGWTTFNSATFAVVGQGFVAVNITFRNTAGPEKHQAVAVRNGADMSAFYSCGFEGYQDTLYTHSLRQFYRDCEIYGTVDYIFGNAAVIFQNCRINSRQPLENQFNAITAQARTDPNQNTGIIIQNCTIKEAKDLATGNLTIKTYLGRPWREYSRTVIMQSYIASLVDPAGWTPWSGDFALDTLYYAEFNNSGIGSRTGNRVTWPGFRVINSTDTANFTVSNFVQGDSWLPAAGVPYSVL